MIGPGSPIKWNIHMNDGMSPVPKKLYRQEIIKVCAGIASYSYLKLVGKDGNLNKKLKN
jgi:hypothetical protein